RRRGGSPKRSLRGLIFVPSRGPRGRSHPRGEDKRRGPRCFLRAVVAQGSTSTCRRPLARRPLAKVACPAAPGRIQIPLQIPSKSGDTRGLSSTFLENLPLISSRRFDSHDLWSYNSIASTYCSDHLFGALYTADAAAEAA